MVMHALAKRLKGTDDRSLVASPRPAGAPSIHEDKIAALAISGLVVLAISLRLLPVVYWPSFNHPDEIFQATEQAHRLVYGYGLIPWEFQLGARSWLLPGVIAGLMEAARLIGDGPRFYLPVIATFFAGLAVSPVVCCFLWCRRFFGLSGAVVGGMAVAVAPDLVYMGGRTLSGVVAAHVLVIALYLLDRSRARLTSSRALFAGGAALALAGVLRFQLGPVLALIALWSIWRSPRERLPAFAAGVLVVLGLDAVLDTLTLGYPFAPIWRNVLYNLGYGVSSYFGVEPWWDYPGLWFVYWRLWFFFFGAAAIIGARRLPLLAISAVALVVIFSFIAHKEYRFVYPAAVLATILVGVALAQAATFVGELLRRRGGSKLLAGPICAATIMALWSAVCLDVWYSPVFAKMRTGSRDYLSAVSFAARVPDTCGFGFYGPRWEYAPPGGYTYVHRRLPIYTPDDTILAMAPGFNTVVYALPLPPALGFSRLACFGKICVAHRAGGCAPIPMPPMPLPGPLRSVEQTSR